jgi:nucleotidyltransferase/DNA polymerase involved in DNA repair
MRIACVAVPTFAVAVERRADPALAGQPLAVYERNAVLDASPELTGLERGLSLRKAKALHPYALFIEAHHALYREVAEAMVDAIEGVTPCVEPSGLGIAYGDLTGLAGHYEDEFALAAALAATVQDATALVPSVGIATGKFVAWVAASITPPGDAGVVPPGREREFVLDKDIALLPFGSAQDKPFGPEVGQRLDLLAMRTFGDIASLPQPAVEAQFRRAGRRLWELANGIDSDPLRPRKPQELLTERLAFEAPVVATEALLAAGRQIVSRLVRRLRGRTARRMHVQLLADERIVWERLETFREPTGDERRMLLLIKTRLSLLELPQAVDTVAVTLSGIGYEVAKQAKLFTDSQQNLNQIAQAIKQLRARYNRPVVWRVMEVNPCSRHPEERTVLVPYDA